MTRKVLVAGVGNIFLGDDAFGVEVCRSLSQRDLPPDVVVKDFGIRSYDLGYTLMEDWDLVILVDTLSQGEKPGTMYLLDPDVLSTKGTPLFDAHSMNPESVLQLVRALGGNLPRLLVVGCEPDVAEFNVEGQVGLSAPVQAQLGEAVRMVEELIARECSHTRMA